MTTPLRRLVETAEASAATVEYFSALKRPPRYEVERHIKITLGLIASCREFDEHGTHLLAVAATERRLKEATGNLNMNNPNGRPYMI